MGAPHGAYEVHHHVPAELIHAQPVLSTSCPPLPTVDHGKPHDCKAIRQRIAAYDDTELDRYLELDGRLVGL